MKKILYYSVFILFFLKNSAFSIESDSLILSGCVSQGFLKTTEYNYLSPDSKEGTYKFGEGLMNISYLPYDNLRVGMSIAYRRLGAIGENAPYINWAIGDYSFRKWLSFRVGIMKAPLGFYNETRDMDQFRTSVVLPFGVYRETLRDYYDKISGACFYGLFSNQYLGSLKYQASVGTQKKDLNSGATRTFQDGLKRRFPSGVKISDIEEDNGIYNIDLSWQTPIRGLQLKYTFHDTGDTNLTLKADMLTTDVIYSMKNNHTQTIGARFIFENFMIEGEYLDCILDTTGYVGSTPLFKNDYIEFLGSYVNTTYRFAPWLEAGFYFSRFELMGIKTYHDGRDMNEYCFSLRFDLAENVIFKLEAHQFIRVCDEPLLLDNPGNYGSEDKWMMFASKITLSF